MTQKKELLRLRRQLHDKGQEVEERFAFLFPRVEDESLYLTAVLEYLNQLRGLASIISSKYKVEKIEWTEKRLGIKSFYIRLESVGDYASFIKLLSLWRQKPSPLLIERIIVKRSPKVGVQYILELRGYFRVRPE